MPDTENIQGAYLSGAPNSHAELRSLIKECVQGNLKAQRKLYETFAPAAWNLVKRYVFQDEPAQEILNDAFYKVFTRLEQYNWQGPFEAWIRRITVNTVADYLRKYLSKEKMEKREVEEDMVWVESEAVSNMGFKELVGFTFQLTGMQRTVFNFFVFENMTHKEIGEALEISEGNSRYILSDARKTLKQIIMKQIK